MMQRRKKTVSRTANTRSTLERPSLSLQLTSPTLTRPRELGRRIFELVYDKPFEEAIPSLGMVIVCLLLAEARDPAEAVDAFAVLLRQLVDDARQQGPGTATALNQARH